MERTIPPAAALLILLLGTARTRQTERPRLPCPNAAQLAWQEA